MSHFVVVGAGQAGASLVARLREQGFEDEITLIGEEAYIPYQRPPLSKKYLTGEMELERLFLKPQSFYDENNIKLVTGQRVSEINPTSKTIIVGDETISYDKLALTTGSRPRFLPNSVGGNLKRVYVVRNLKDIDAMMPEFVDGAKVLIIGGGYIGLEAAAVANSKGLKVTLVEMADRILQRVACENTSDYFRQLHEGHGVKILEQVGLERLNGTDQVTSATLTNGKTIDVDFVIAGIGIVPNLDLAQEAGLEIENGIKVDEFGQSSDPNIFAAGDCCSFPYQGGRLRLESVPNAIDQAKANADSMIGKGQTYIPKIWFWSDQYDVKLQIAGLNTGYDNVVTRDSRQDGKGGVSFWYFKGEKLLAVDAANDPRPYMMAKRWIEAGLSPDREQIKDVSLDVKNMDVS